VGQTWLRAASGDTLSVRWFGATGNGVTDDTAAIRSAIAAAAALTTVIPGALFAGVDIVYYNGATVHFPGGIYLVTSTIEINTAAIKFSGDGHSQSTIYRSGNYGDTLYFTPNPLAATPALEGNAIQDLCFMAVNTAPTSGAHIHMVACFEAVLQNLRVMGHFGGIQLQACSNIAADNIRMGAGYFAWTATPTNSYFLQIGSMAGTMFNSNSSTISFANFNFQGGASATTTASVEFGILLISCDFATFTGGYCGAVTGAALQIQPNSGTDRVDNIKFNSVEFDGNFNTGSSLSCVIANPSGGGVSAVSFYQCDFINSFTGFSANASGTTLCSVVGCNMGGNRQIGLEILNGQGWIISDNQIANNSTAGAGSANAVFAFLSLSAVTDLIVEGNFVGSTAGGLANPGMSFAGTIPNACVTGNMFSGNSAGNNVVGQSNLGSASVVANNVAG